MEIRFSWQKFCQSAIFYSTLIWASFRDSSFDSESYSESVRAGGSKLLAELAVGVSTFLIRDDLLPTGWWCLSVLRYARSSMSDELLSESELWMCLFLTAPVLLGGTDPDSCSSDAPCAVSGAGLVLLLKKVSAIACASISDSNSSSESISLGGSRL